jgi:hypothetical protein
MEIINRRGALNRFREAVKNGKVTLGFIGGSITEAVQESNWPAFVRWHLVSRKPDMRLTMEDAAVGGTGALSGVMRAEQDLIRPGSDLVFIEYAVNDYGTPGEERQREMEGLIRKLLRENRDAVMVYTFSQAMYEYMREGKIPQSIADFETLAEHYNLPSVWVGKYAFDSLQQGAISWEGWLPVIGGGLHPHFLGSRLYAEKVIEFLEMELAGGNTRAIRCGALLPPALNNKNFEAMSDIPFSDITLKGPWSFEREVVIPWYRQVLYSGADGAGLSFSFSGRALAVMLNFGKRSAVIRYRIDGGDWKEFFGPRDWWVPDKDYCTPALLAGDLSEGRHQFEMVLAHGNKEECKGTDCKIYTFACVK